ncbi:enoyl-CoA hydratase [Marinobacterium jannaschii]|uniref:enoyl-CoA hydratase n=1 Tax=Marinobacterium jannaschii TaxID=64970 RepID=UPI000684E8AD|nr:enoyl-CoA hydratase [Marinobacterium jannaschii]
MELIVEIEQRVMMLKLNRPEKQNALNLALYDGLTAALQQAAEDPQIRAVCLSGEGKNFCSGNDIGDFLSSGLAGLERSVVPFLHTLAAFPKPLVAAVQGNAVGIGTTLMLHCDLVYIDDTARFKLPFVDLGLVPEAGSSMLLPQLVGDRRAAEMLLLCESFGPEEAQELGLINRQLAADELQGFAYSQAQRLAAKPPAALAQAKALIRRRNAASLQQTIDIEAAAFARQLTSPEAMEALTAFKERRAPDFSRFD